MGPTHTRILVGKIPWTEEPGGLQFVGSQRAGHDWEAAAVLPESSLLLSLSSVTISTG